MRRSTAAALGTLTGAALIMGARLGVSASTVAAPPAAGYAPAPAPAKSSTGGEAGGGKASARNRSGLKDGRYAGKPVAEPYGTVQVRITVSGGRITAADASYPTTGYSATVNPGAVAALKQSTLKAQSAKVDAVSGATYTSQAYAESLQAALDAARG
jgi:uncharacterized protein with FMN-binding domain